MTHPLKTLTAAAAVALTAAPAFADFTRRDAEALCRQTALGQFGAFDTTGVAVEKIEGRDFFVRGVARRNDKRNMAFACRARNGTVLAMKGQPTRNNGRDEDIDPLVAAALIAAIAAVAVSN